MENEAEAQTFLDVLTAYYGEYEDYANVVLVFFVAVASYYVFKLYLVRFLTFAVKKTRTSWDDLLVEEKVFRHLPYLAPAVVFYFGAPLFPDFLVPALERVATSYIAINIVILVDRVLNVGLKLYRRHPMAKQRPIKSYVQVVKIFVYIMGGIVAISLLINQSPWAFLGGIGALTAVLMLIFRDTILSFVASIQISNNDMARVGDWVEMPKYSADGDVVEMALNTIKVQNWDKTITTIPTYKLVEDSFKNWRGMQDCGGRRISRSLLIDQASVRFLDDKAKDRLTKIQILKDYIDAKDKELDEHNEEHGYDTSEVLNGRRLTNIGTFRAYVVAYLKHHPNIREDMTFLVRLLAPTAEGIPLQVYVFADTTAWIPYEAIQSDIFDHFLAALPEFGLRVYQHPSSGDMTGISAAVGQKEG